MFDDKPDYTDPETIAAILADLGYDDTDPDDVMIYEGSLADYCAEMAEDCGHLASVPEHIRFHIDWCGLARDMILNGDAIEITDHRNDSISPRYFAEDRDDTVWIVNGNSL